MEFYKNRLGHTSVRVSLSILNHRMASITNKNCKFKVKRKFKNYRFMKERISIEL
jgi:hypothetical protein